MTPKLIALDLDGTTLNQDGKLSILTKQVLQKAQAVGHRVVIATGRPDSISESIYDELHLQTPMINFNGALVHIPHQQWQYEHMQTLALQTVTALLTLREQFPIKVMVAEGKKLLLADRPYTNIPFLPDMPNPERLLSATTLQQAPISVTMFIEEQRTLDLRAAIQAQNFPVSVQSWGSWSGENAALEVVTQNINKAVALDYVAHKLGFKQQDVIAFGDDDNDLEMLNYAGLGIAMKNANPKILDRVPRQISLTNAEDGVAHFLADYLEF
ncbi:had hydrolase, iib family protein [Lapidilactobacillus dextrinicus DSM 20335]|uniref:Had hydrolase, iib family protein n=1 Tax=Lapidilactobacillus dextrinicus DSM 20335 TaxID=1423738 RepID=A0A0R2BVH9_9LACO|nr:Cof-type HAD-IIB family hydrolase [Lapidilactobacillus dextrinicus]KRM79836.1 had hydrolase, iib family protein [Lapidilactobacillus dextrinicus DSM 20335]QFG46379.1 Cof-type HAD-IIB family hydrolase [Lapidilactobacillus dextrinicus]